MNLYDLISKLCKERGMTITKLAEESEVSLSAIKTWNYGQKPAFDSVLKIARTLGVSIDYLAGETDIPTPIQDYVADADMAELQRARSRMSQKDRVRMMKILRIGFDYAFEED